MTISKKPIDLRYPHLIPMRIKQYALDIFDTVQKYPSVDPIIQKTRLLLERAEELLKKDSMNSPYFEKTRSDYNRLKGLKALIDGYEDWRNCRGIEDIFYNSNHLFNLAKVFPYPFFLTYYAENNLTSPMGALHELLGNETDILPPDYDFSLEDIKNLKGSRYNKDSVSSHGNRKDSYTQYHSSEFDYWEYTKTCYPPDGTGAERFAPLNYSILIDYEDYNPFRPVFVVEKIKAASDLEKDIKNEELRFLLTTLKKVGYIQREMKDTDINHAYTSPEDRLLGDAVVVAPVGGYYIPEYTGWYNFINRDIYIFKFGEKDPDTYLSQLLKVTSCIVRDTEKAEDDPDVTKRIKYVVMAQKSGIEVQNNDIKYWDIEELFIEAKTHGCLIPENLKQKFDRYFRYKTRHVNPYLVEPFLRRKSWMLLTGEEGTGKSYMALALSAAIATHGKLCFPDWRIRQRKKARVLYIADIEMTDDIIHERMAVLKKLYRGCEKNLIVKSEKNVNLCDEKGQNKIQKYIDEEKESPVDVLVLDHLLKLSNVEGDQKESWPRIREWIEKLNEQGLTVILLHHEYAAKRMLGTRLIAADAPARLHLDIVDQPVEDAVDFSVSIVKNRGGRLQRGPRKVRLYIGGHPKWSLPDEKNDAPEEPKHSGSMSMNERKRARFERFFELRKKGLENPEIAEELKCSISTVEKMVPFLPEDMRRRKKE